MPSVITATPLSHIHPPTRAHLQQPFEVLAFGVAGSRLRIGVVIVPPVPPTARQPSVVLEVAPVLEFLLVVLQQHQRGEQTVAAAAAIG